MPVTPEELEELAARYDVAPSTARRYLRAHVTLADGRVISGQRPGCAGVTITEHWLRDELASQLCGITEALLPYGRADVLTATAVFEVEAARKWRAGMRQVLAYSAQTGLPPALALFGNAHRDDVLKRYLTLRDGRPPVQLWWHGGYRWHHIASRRVCRNMEAPARGSAESQ
jgi:hypothetical protein